MYKKTDYFFFMFFFLTLFALKCINLFLYAIYRSEAP